MSIQPVASLFSYFRSIVEDADERLRVRTGAATKDYLARMLSDCAGGAGPTRSSSLVLTLDDALSRGEGEQVLGLQAVGDRALCLLGFFPESLSRDGLEEGLYVQVGSFAYGRAGKLLGQHGASEPTVLVELGEKFPLIVDVVAEVAESSALGAVTRNLVQAFDRWKGTGSQRAFDALVRAGVVPGRGGGQA